MTTEWTDTTGPPMVDWAKVGNTIIEHAPTVLDYVVALGIVILLFILLERGGRLFFGWLKKRRDEDADIQRQIVALQMEKKLRHQFRHCRRAFLIADIVHDALLEANVKNVITNKEYRWAMETIGYNGLADCLPNKQKLSKDAQRWLCNQVRARLGTHTPVNLGEISVNELKFLLGKG